MDNNTSDELLLETLIEKTVDNTIEKEDTKNNTNVKVKSKNNFYSVVTIIVIFLPFIALFIFEILFGISELHAYNVYPVDFVACEEGCFFDREWIRDAGIVNIVAGELSLFGLCMAMYICCTGSFDDGITGHKFGLTFLLNIFQ